MEETTNKKNEALIGSKRVGLKAHHRVKTINLSSTVYWTPGMQILAQGKDNASEKEEANGPRNSNKRVGMT